MQHELPGSILAQHRPVGGGGATTRLAATASAPGLWPGRLLAATGGSCRRACARQKEEPAGCSVHPDPPVIGAAGGLLDVARGGGLPASHRGHTTSAPERWSGGACRPNAARERASLAGRHPGPSRSWAWAGKTRIANPAGSHAPPEEVRGGACWGPAGTNPGRRTGHPGRIVSLPHPARRALSATLPAGPSPRRGTLPVAPAHPTVEPGGCRRAPRVAALWRPAGDAALVTRLARRAPDPVGSLQRLPANALAHALAVTPHRHPATPVAPARRGPGRKAPGELVSPSVCRAWPVGAPCPSLLPEPEGSRGKGAGHCQFAYRRPRAHRNGQIAS